MQPKMPPALATCSFVSSSARFLAFNSCALAARKCSSSFAAAFASSASVKIRWTLMYAMGKRAACLRKRAVRPDMNRPPTRPAKRAFVMTPSDHYNPRRKPFTEVARWDRIDSSASYTSLRNIFMKSMLIALTSAVLGSILSLAVVGHAQSSKTPSAVAFISANRILNESTHGRSEMGRIQSLQQRANADLRTKQQALEATRQQLAAATDNAVKLTLQQKEQQQRAELERATQQAQTDLQNLQREINLDLQQRVKTTLDDLMKTQAYQAVLNADVNLMWSTPELDLTPAVVGRMNGQP